MGFPLGSIGKVATSPNLALGSQLATGVFGSVMGMIPQGGGGGGMQNPYETNQPAFQAAWDMQMEGVNQEAGALQKQAQTALQEAGREAQIKARDVKEFREMQALKYSGQGVLLEGSPMIVLEETRKRGQQEIDAILRRGAAQADLLRRQAMMVSNKGRAALLGQQAQFGFDKAQFDAQQLGEAGSPFNAAAIGDILQAIAGIGGMFPKKPVQPPVVVPPITNPGVPGAPVTGPGLPAPGSIPMYPSPQQQRPFPPIIINMPTGRLPYRSIPYRYPKPPGW